MKLRRVAWLAPYPVGDLNCGKGLAANSRAHSSTWIVNLSQALIRSFDLECHIFTRSPDIQRDRIFTDGNLHVHVLRSPRFFRYLTLLASDRMKFHQKLRALNPDLVHTHGTEDIYSYAGVSSPFPTLVSIQGIISKLVLQNGSNTLRNRLWQHLERYTVRKGKYFIAKTAFAARFIRSQNEKGVIFHIANPVFEPLFSVNRCPAAVPVILFIGSLRREKGIEDLIEAMGCLRNHSLDWTVRAIGPVKTDYLCSLRARIEALGMTERFQFIGFKEPAELVQEYSQAAMLVLPSYMETSPNVVAEAMVAGVPVVATQVGGIPDMVTDGQTGLLTQVGNTEALAAKIQELLLNQTLAAEIAFAARQQARKKYLPQRIAQQVYAAYQTILQQEKRIT
jgi:glycosyltransferase involved in cell wall biosynthesis